jgi:hypothetical protein
LTLSKPNVPRVIVYPNNAIAASLLNHHKSSGADVVSVADCVAAGMVRLPMPDELLWNLDKKIQDQNGRVVVVGIDAYLSLISEDNATAFFVALRGRIDEGKLNAVYLVGDGHNLHLNNPRYEESLNVVKINGDLEYIEPPHVEVVSDKWVKSGNLVDYHTLLKQLGGFLPTGNHTLVLKGLRSEQAGLGNNVSFVLDIQRIAEHFYGVSANLVSATIELLLSKTKKSGVTPESYLETEFVEANIDVRLAIKRLLELPDDDLWAAYVWLLQKRLPAADTYLAKVLSSDVTCGNLLRKYVVDIAVTVLNDNDAEKFAAERANALTGLSVESLIVEFIGQTKNIDSAAKFLNCGTTAERIELVRRVSKLDLTAGLPEPFVRLYPALTDYLSSEYDYGSSDLTSYFKEYRKLKIANTVTEAFVKKAYDFVLPVSFPARESLLADLRTDDTALLVVDGMGAEYLPLLLAMARRRNMNLDSFTVVSVKLPTSTKFNPIVWDSKRTLDTIKEIDTVIHYGAAKNEINLPERNIEKGLRTFDEVFNRIATGLNKFFRVVLTADHGTSRLAVLAHNSNLGTTLSWNGQPDDWRYSVAPEGVTRPLEFEQQYHPDSGKTYWVVRGYNRLPKSGGKLYELHGGASLEERLVPVIVFTKAKPTAPPKELGKKTTEELIDKFADLI